MKTETLREPVSETERVITITQRNTRDGRCYSLNIGTLKIPISENEIVAIREQSFYLGGE